MVNLNGMAILIFRVKMANFLEVFTFKMSYKSKSD